MTCICSFLYFCYSNVGNISIPYELLERLDHPLSPQASALTLPAPPKRAPTRPPRALTFYITLTRDPSKSNEHFPQPPTHFTTSLPAIAKNHARQPLPAHNTSPPSPILQPSSPRARIPPQNPLATLPPQRQHPWKPPPTSAIHVRRFSKGAFTAAATTRTSAILKTGNQTRPRSQSGCAQGAQARDVSEESP